MANRIKPYRAQTAQQQDPGMAEDAWRLLRDAIVKIQHQDASQLSFEELYRNAYNMVLHKKGERLYKGLHDVVADHLQTVAADVEAAMEGDLLAVLRAHWDRHKMAMLMVRDILMYMDKHYVSTAGVAPVYEAGLALFLERVVGSGRIKTSLTSTLLGLVARERASEVVDRALVRNILAMLAELGISSRAVYEDVFERQLLDATAQHYRLASAQFLAMNNAATYLRQVERWLADELERVEHYMLPETEPKLRSVLDAELISRHMQQVIAMEHSGMVFMMENNRLEDLQLLYRLLQRVEGGLHSLCDCMGQHLRTVGKALVTSQDAGRDANKYVGDLLALKDTYDQLLKAAFASDQKFTQTLGAAFTQFINVNSKSAEFLSLFIDGQLKRGAKGASEDDMDGLLDRTIMLFRYLEDKDVFERYYKNHLAKRLLQQRSQSDDAERSMISKLRVECGNLFTSKLEGMFKDMSISKDTMAAFRQHLQDRDVAVGLDLSVQVLTTTYWPVHSDPATAILPPPLQDGCKSFETFYLGAHNGRKLTWQMQMGTGDVRGQFDKAYVLTMSTYQMLVLLLFNDLQPTDTLALEVIAERTGIPNGALRRALQSLACGKIKVLAKTPKGKDINDGDSFAVNTLFTSKNIRVKIPMVAQKETEKESQDTRQRVDDDRKHVIEACVVRIMKARKTMDHNNLVAEVTAQLAGRFLPNPQVIKQRIENLIEKEYLERNKDDRKRYHYKA